MIKLNKLKKVICTWNHVQIDTDIGSQQWIGTGGALYLAEGLPKLECIHLPQLMGIKDKEWQTIDTRDGESLDMDFEYLREDCEGNEPLIPLVEMNCVLKFGDTVLQPMEGGGKIIFLREDEMEVYETTEQTHYLMKNIHGHWVVGVMQGMFVEAILTEAGFPDETVKKMNRMATAAAAARDRWTAQEAIDEDI